MAQKQLHPTVERFKTYVKGNPSVLKEVRSGKKTMQQLYEEWYVIKDDEQGASATEKDQDKATSNEDKQDWVNQIMGTVKNMDVNQVQGYISNMSQALGAIQGVLSQFQGGSTNSKGSARSNNPSTQKPNPFTFKKD